MKIEDQRAYIDISENMSEEELMVLDYFLQYSEANKEQFEQGVPYAFPMVMDHLCQFSHERMAEYPYSNLRSIQLSQRIVKRESHNNPSVFNLSNYEVLGGFLGEGGTSTVDDCIGTLSRRYDGGLEFVNTVHRVAKNI